MREKKPRVQFSFPTFLSNQTGYGEKERDQRRRLELGFRRRGVGSEGPHSLGQLNPEPLTFPGRRRSSEHFILHFLLHNILILAHYRPCNTPEHAPITEQNKTPKKEGEKNDLGHNTENLSSDPEMDVICA